MYRYTKRKKKTMAKKVKKDPIRTAVTEKLTSLGNAQKNNEIEISEELKGSRSHAKKHCADTPIEQLDKKDRETYLANPNIGDVPSLCVARTLENTNTQTKDGDTSYFASKKDMNNAYADTILKNSRRITAFYCQDKTISEKFTSRIENKIDAPKGFIIRRNPNTGAIREYGANEINLVMRHDQTQIPRVSPKLTGLSHVTCYASIKEPPPARETGRDLRPDVSKTKTFATSSTLKKAYLLSCCDPENTPVPTQLIEMGKTAHVIIPLGATGAAIHLQDSYKGPKMTLIAKDGKTEFDWNNPRVQNAIEKTQDTFKDQYDFADDIMKNSRNPEKFVPKGRNKNKIERQENIQKKTDEKELI